MLNAPHHYQAYLQAHRALRSLWLEPDGAVFAELSPHEQWYLHDYFRPSEQLPDQDLLAHRKAISRQRPCLPQSAGRALSLLVRMLQTYVEPRPAVIRKPGERLPTTRVHHITVRAVVQPEPDVARYAPAVVQMVMKKHEKDHRAQP